MANDLTTRVWYIDTASNTPIWLSQVLIKFVEWFNPANSDGFQLQDMNGHPIISGTAIVAGDTQTFNIENWYRGLIVKALSTTNQGDTPPGSVLYVHVR